MNERAAGPERVVLGVDVLAMSFTDEACWQVLARWRDGLLRPVVTRPLLETYGRLLNALGIPAPLIRQWFLWFASAEKCLYLGETECQATNSAEVHAEAARLGRARCVIIARDDYWLRRTDQAPASEITWLTASHYLRRTEPPA